ncbi:hypothetical protein FACS189418_1550 [Clostridia bacterium]|nr:hypothetical protein FACS189418_1550 [Clostridia bacterium]
MNRVRSIIQAPTLDAPYLGQNIGIAVLDTGIYPHPDFHQRIAGFFDVTHMRKKIYDDCGHGTHVSGIIAGDGTASDGRFQGIAPKAHIVSVKVLDHKGNGNISSLLKGIRWILQHKDQLQIRIMNISAGTPSKRKEDEYSSLIRGVEDAWDAGLVVVTAAGNNGPHPMSITTPGISRKVITVGCSDDDKTANIMGSKMIHYSGRGPTASCILKPEIVAPGSNITSCSSKKSRNQLYCSKSGTSMATPVVSGAIAVLLSKYPHLNNVEVKLLLRKTAQNIGLNRSQQGWGMINVENLLNETLLTENLLVDYFSGTHSR